ncbi:MAG: helix-turn-helix transcriptional regulator [Gemmatimonadaceae bacterium]|nr:helix-turn-helix transcriptional regulator [Gemmatimonadaceae bacterium]
MSSVSQTTELTVDPSESPRLEPILEAALLLFLRFGFRKTSMQDVADAARISRQGLYLHFPGKEQLFRAVAVHALSRGLDEARTALAADGPLTERIPNAFDAWVGRFVGLGNTDASDLAEVGHALIGPDVATFEKQFDAAVAACLESSEMRELFERGQVTPQHVAAVLHAVARGTKHSVSSREQFREQLVIATRVLCVSSAGSC